MGRFVSTLIVVTVAFAAPAAGAGAATINQLAVTSGDSDVQTTPLFARIARPFGAAVRVGPSPYQEQLASLACGEVRPVLDRRDGWVQLQYGDDGRDRGWVSERLVTLGGSAPPVDCTAARFLPVGSEAYTSAPSGCASLRARPARFAVELACVEDGHDLEIVSGPFDPDGRDVWFEVWSPSTDSGWVLADELSAV
jgi:hypothetical protein